MALSDEHGGRQPTTHVVLSTIAAGDLYSARTGQTFYVIDPIALVTQHRVGNGKPGGHLIASTVMASLPALVARVANIENVLIDAPAGGGTVIVHGLGYYPMVQVLDHSTTPPSLAVVDFEHTDLNTITLFASPAIGVASVLLR